MILRVALAGAFGVVCVFAFLRSFEFPDIAGYFPRFAGGAGAILAVIELARIGASALRSRSGRSPAAAKPNGAGSEGATFSVGVCYLGWATGLVALVYVFGAIIAVPVWLTLYGLVAGKIRWTILLTGSVILELALFAMAYLGFIEIPPGVLL